MPDRNDRIQRGNNLQSNTHHNQQARAAKLDRHPHKIAQDDGHSCDDSQDTGAQERDRVRGLPEMFGSGKSGTDAGDRGSRNTQVV